MRDEHHRAPVVGARPEQPQHLGPRFHVEVARRLVGQQDGWIVDERSRDREALLLAPGELGGKRLRDRPQPEPVDELAGAPLGVGVRATHPRREQHVRFPGQLGQQVEELEDEADSAPPQRAQRAFGSAGHALAAELDQAGLRAVEAAEQVQQRRLARTRAAEHRDDLAGGDLEIRAVQDAPRRPARTEGLHQPVRADGRHYLTVRTAAPLVSVSRSTRRPPAADRTPATSASVDAHPYGSVNAAATHLAFCSAGRHSPTVDANSHPRGSLLVVDDEPTIAEVLSRYLERAGYETRIAADGPQALELAGDRRPDLVILDLMLPGLDGLEVMRRLRAFDEGSVRPRVPIILLTARGEESDRVVGLQLGADDYVVKPFSPKELVARVDAVLRRADPDRTAGAQQEPLEFGAVRIEPDPRRAFVRGEEAALTQREFDLLLFLARHPGRVFSRDQLMDAVWQYAFYTDTSTVTVHIRRLRAKIEQDPARPQHVQTVWGVGYRFQP